MLGPTSLRNAALAALDGVGDAELGEWREMGDRAFHVRRRLTAAEALTVGPVVDVRDVADEVERRMRPVRHLVPEGWKE